VEISGWAAEVAPSAFLSVPSSQPYIAEDTYFPPLMPIKEQPPAHPSSLSVMYQHSCWDRKPWRPEACNGQIHLEAEIGWLVLRSFHRKSEFSLVRL
jgi:hypothetical protein